MFAIRYQPQQGQRRYDPPVSQNAVLIVASAVVAVAARVVVAIGAGPSCDRANGCCVTLRYGAVNDGNETTLISSVFPSKEEEDEEMVGVCVCRCVAPRESCLGKRSQVGGRGALRDCQRMNKTAPSLRGFVASVARVAYSFRFVSMPACFSSCCAALLSFVALFVRLFVCSLVRSLCFTRNKKDGAGKINNKQKRPENQKNSTTWRYVTDWKLLCGFSLLLLLLLLLYCCCLGPLLWIGVFFSQSLYSPLSLSLFLSVPRFSPVCIPYHVCVCVCVSHCVCMQAHVSLRLHPSHAGT